jgi:hypothetical protein
MGIGFSWNPMGTVSKIISTWNPTGCNIEKDFERSLVEELRLQMPDVSIQQQYGAARQRVDVVVGKKVAIELKKNLKTTGGYQRAIGQLEHLVEDWELIIIVICGLVDEDLLQSFKKHAAKHDASNFLVPGKSIEVIVKTMEN